MKKKTTKKRKTSYKRKNIPGNFRGAEDIFFIKISAGIQKFLETPFKKSNTISDHPENIYNGSNINMN